MLKPERQIDDWLATPLGQALLEAEIAQLERITAQFFGFHLLQIGDWGPLQGVREQALSRQSVLLASRPGTHVQIVSEPSQLAIASDTVDGVILPHTLEFNSQPHHVLREAERVLTGEGKIAILGFNPFGFWGARRLLGTRRFLPGLTHMMSRKRICDWLRLLGFEMLETHTFFYRVPINHRVVLERTGAYENFAGRLGGFMSGAYLVMAKKCVYSALPPRVVKLRKKAAVVGGLVEPTSRNHG